MIHLRHAWLQKHATPAADGGEFHWYPPEEDRELRAACVERMRGVDPPAVVWELGPGRVVWGRPFATVAPDDGRRYVGMALTIAEGEGQSPAQLLEGLVLPVAAPWNTATDLGISLAVELAERAKPVRTTFAPEVDAGAIARVLMSGGVARVGDPAIAELPRWIASLERWMPAAVTARVRRGTWSAGTGPSPVVDRAAAIVVEAWRTPTSRAAEAWRLLVELAEVRGEPIDQALAGSRDAVRGALTDEERAVLAGPRELVDVLHAWGRGRLDQCPTAGTLTARLADAVALRMLAQLVEGRDAGGVLAEARWHALLPAARRATLLSTIVERAGSLRRFVEVGDA